MQPRTRKNTPTPPVTGPDYPHTPGRKPTRQATATTPSTDSQVTSAHTANPAGLSTTRHPAPTLPHHPFPTSQTIRQANRHTVRGTDRQPGGNRALHGRPTRSLLHCRVGCARVCGFGGWRVGLLWGTRQPHIGSHAGPGLLSRDTQPRSRPAGSTASFCSGEARWWYGWRWAFRRVTVRSAPGRERRGAPGPSADASRLTLP